MVRFHPAPLTYHMPELVVLVDEANIPIGTADKNAVHTANTPLHRGFSLFIFNSKRQVLLTKRADTKKTFPGVWTNTVCGHPAPGESVTAAAKRRLSHELGIADVDVEEVAPYRYRVADQNGIMENEICPICVGQYQRDPVPHPGEVDDWKWMDWNEFLREIHDNPMAYSPWSVAEAKILASKQIQLIDRVSP